MNSLYLKRLRLVNFCSYENETFSFMKDNGEPYRFVCFFGPNGIGKCEVGSTYIDTLEHGMIHIRDLFSGLSLKPDSWYPANLNINLNGSYHQVRQIYYNGKSKTIKLTTKRGYKLEGSRDLHRVLACKNGKIEFVKISELKTNDIVCISRKSQITGNYMPLDLAKLLGYLIAEGHIDENSAVFTNSDEEIICDFYQTCQKVFRIFNPKIRQHGKLKVIGIHGDNLRNLKQLGLTELLSGDKEVPKSVLSASVDAVRAFLMAYFEGDGGVEKAIKAVTCVSKSYELMHQVHLLLLRLGIVASLHLKHCNKLSYTNKPYDSWRITIQGNNVQKFAEKIGFISSRKRKELAQLLKNSNNPNYDVVPSSLLFGLHRMVQKHIEDTERTFSRSDYHNTSNGLHILQPNYLRAVKKGISKNKIDRCFETCGFTPDETLSWLSEDYLFDEIAEAKDGFDDLFDICVENEHAYWTNGFISHNSTILEAISLLNWNMTNRGYSLVDTREAARNVLRQYVYDQDYQPAYERLKDYRYNSQTSEQFEKKKEEKGLDMLVEGIFDLDGKEYAVQLTQDGYVRNDFAPVLNDLDATDEEISTEMRKGPWGEEHLKYRQRMIHHISSDNDLSMSKFQLHYPMAPKFDDIIELIMRFPTHCIVPKGLTEYDQGYCTDIVVDKVQKHRGDRKTRVHYKRFSAGERKICKSFSQILNLMYDLENPGYNEIALPGWPPILLMDNIEMHVYFDRHVTMVDRVKEVFQKQQVFVTTHSGILVPRYQRDGHDADSELYIDLEPVNG